MCRWLVTCKFSLKFPFIEIGSYQLIMEREAKEKRGVFVQKKVLIIGAIFFLITIVVVALLTHYSTNTVCTRKSIDGNEEKSQQSPTPTPQPTPPLLDVRLPKSIQPLHYNLSLQPFFDNFTFHGTVAIQIECLQKANNITLHANNITLRDESTKLISTGSAGSPRITSYNYDSRRQFLVFQLSDYLQVKGVYELSLEFDGSLNDKLVGFYRSKYDNDRWMATTQFEPTDARRAFPCFDEPGLKANFSVSLIRSKQDISISNMPQIKNETQDNNWVKDVYETTPKMSTYLLAFVITNFSYMDSKSQGDINFRVYSRHEAISQTKFASEFGPKVLDFYDQYFNVNYPLPKQDMIAIPDFGAGAMENWGLITYRETALLYDENVSSVMNKERVAIVIAHELAHQWFGNLVSPTWWDYLWLNEGFAAYMERFCTDKLYPKWKMIERFASIMQSVLKDDSLKSSHPVYVPVQNPDQINEIFDSISYQKGASIIRMMVNFLGEDVFKNGLTTYFNDKKYGNAVQDELWRHMTEAAGKKIDVKRVMDTWTVQTGYPVVTVTRNTQDQSMTFTQKIFHLIPDNSVSNDKWEIPITFTSKSKSDFSKTVPVKWINNTESSIKVTVDDGIPPENEWIILNIQQTGYYRVNYEKKNWEMITTQLNNPNDFDKIHVLNRAQLIDDSFSLARAGQLDYEIALKLSKYLENEKELVPWQTAIRNFGYIDAMLKKTEIYGLWQKFVLKLTTQQYNANNFQDIIATDDNHIEVIFQGLFVAQACQLDVEDCVTKSVSAFNKWIADSNTNKLSPSLRDTILCKAIEKGGINEWDNLWIKYNTSNVGSEKVSLLNALTCTQQPWIINKMLNMILNPNTGVRSQDSPIITSGIAGNKVGRYLLFDYVRANLKELTDKFGQAFLLPKILKSALANFNTQFELNQLNQFIKDNKPQLIQVERSIRQIVESTESNIKWMNDNYEKIRSWLESEI